MLTSEDQQVQQLTSENQQVQRALEDAAAIAANLNAALETLAEMEAAFLSEFKGMDDNARKQQNADIRKRRANILEEYKAIIGSARNALRAAESAHNAAYCFLGTCDRIESAAAQRVVDISYLIMQAQKSLLLSLREKVEMPGIRARAFNEFGSIAESAEADRSIKAHIEKVVLRFFPDELIEAAKLAKLEETECRIRGTILNAIYDEALDSYNQSLVLFIDANRGALEQGDAAAMALSTEMFAAGKAAQAAWRNYNPNAAWNQYEPFLVAKHVPDTDTNAAHKSDVLEGQARIQDPRDSRYLLAPDNLPRRQAAAACYLAIVEDDPEADEEIISELQAIRESVLIPQFVGQLRDIRREHNSDAGVRQDIDRPACLDGFDKRIGETLTGHPDPFYECVHIADKIIQKDRLRALMAVQFKEHLASLRTLEEKISFYQAMMVFSQENVVTLSQRTRFVHNGEDALDLLEAAVADILPALRIQKESFEARLQGADRQACAVVNPRAAGVQALIALENQAIDLNFESYSQAIFDRETLSLFSEIYQSHMDALFVDAVQSNDRESIATVRAFLELGINIGHILVRQGETLLDRLLHTGHAAADKVALLLNQAELSIDEQFLKKFRMAPRRIQEQVAVKYRNQISHQRQAAQSAKQAKDDEIVVAWLTEEMPRIYTGELTALTDKAREIQRNLPDNVHDNEKMRFARYLAARELTGLAPLNIEEVRATALARRPRVSADDPDVIDTPHVEFSPITQENSILRFLRLTIGRFFVVLAQIATDLIGWQSASHHLMGVRQDYADEWSVWPEPPVLGPIDAVLRGDLTRVRTDAPVSSTSVPGSTISDNTDRAGAASPAPSTRSKI